MPTRNAGHTTLVILNENPADMIHALIVVPMFAPMMTDMACANDNSAAFTNDTVITVVAAEDCTATVTKAPVATPENLFVVIAPNRWRNCGPAIFCRASLITFMP